MYDKLQKLFEQFIPFFIYGIAIALLIGFLFMFSYLLIWGLLIGGILWIIATIIQYFSPDKSTKKNRIIEHDDNKP